MGPFVVLFLITLAQGCALTWCALHAGRWFRILDFPDKQRKLHARATPRTGGVAVCAALALGVVESGWLHSAGIIADTRTVRFTGFMLLSAALLCILGLCDDKYGMRARSKFFWQAVAVLPFVCWGRATSSADLFGWHVDLAWVAVPVMLFWLVSCTNFVNLVDGLDGLASLVGLIVSLTVAVLAWWNQAPAVCLLATILSGALLGFLIFNWPPARIFLGDSGSLPLGFLVGALALEAAAKKAAGLTLVVPVVLLSIPMFDTSMAILRRKLNGRRIGQGDRAHIHHCLRDRGLSPVETLLAMGLMCLVTAVAAILATIFNNDLWAIGICLAALAMLVAGRVFGFNETMLLARHIQAVAIFVRSVPRALRAKFVVVRLKRSAAAGQLDLWHKIVKRAKRLQGVEIEFICEDIASGRELTSLAWCASTNENGAVVNDAPVWQLQYTAPRGAGVQTRIRAAGRAPRRAGLAWLEELAEMLVALCDNWPVDETTAGIVDETTARIAVPQEPRILSVPWRNAVPGADRHESAQQATGIDAA
jgi:UDP-GlcNAc:undecaprenyl-phosphate GlcNAc-1-phosphate transferase